MIDEIDRKIIARLQNDPQSTNKSIASAIDVSESTIALRIRALSENNIMRVVAQRDLFSGGYALMCFAEVEISSKVTRAAKAIAKLDDVFSVSRCLGTPQLLVNFRARDRKHLDNIANDKIGGVPGVERVKSNICLHIIKLEAGYGDLSAPLPPAAFELGDDRDSHITRMLLEDGRIANRAIARALDVSEGNIRQRLRRMYVSKTMRLGVVCDPIVMNQASVAVVKIAVRPSERTKLAELLSGLDGVPFIGTTSGTYNLWCMVQAEDLSRIAGLRDNLIPHVKGIQDMQVMPLINHYLHRYDLVRIR